MKLWIEQHTTDQNNSREPKRLKIKYDQRNRIRIKTSKNELKRIINSLTRPKSISAGPVNCKVCIRPNI